MHLLLLMFHRHVLHRLEDASDDLLLLLLLGSGIQAETSATRASSVFGGGGRFGLGSGRGRGEELDIARVAGTRRVGVGRLGALVGRRHEAGRAVARHQMTDFVLLIALLRWWWLLLLLLLLLLHHHRVVAQLRLRVHRVGRSDRVVVVVVVVGATTIGSHCVVAGACGAGAKGGLLVRAVLALARLVDRVRSAIGRATRVELAVLMMMIVVWMKMMMLVVVVVVRGRLVLIDGRGVDGGGRHRRRHHARRVGRHLGRVAERGQVERLARKKVSIRFNNGYY